MARALTHVHGRRLGIARDGQLTSNDIDITQPTVDATIVVAAEVTNVRDITIQLLNSKGEDIDFVETVEIIMFLNAARTAFVVTGGSTGIELDVDGALLALVAKKVFLATSEADGDISLTWTDTGTEVAFLGLRLPNGRIIMSDALTNA